VPTRKHALRPDPRGDIRPYIGVRIDGTAQRFNLGKDLRQAGVLEERIRTLYRESEALRLSYVQTPSWTAAALHAAKLIQTGLEQIPLPAAAIVNEAAGDGPDMHGFKCVWTKEEGRAEAIFWAHAIASRQYPSVKWLLPDAPAGRLVNDYGEVSFDDEAGRQALLLSLKTPPLPVVGTFHEALDRYKQYLDDQLARNLEPATVEQRRSQIKYLKQAHRDRPLAVLDLAECRLLLGHWTSVPSKSDAERYSRTTCKHRVSELKMFFDWLHASNDFGWRKPEDFDTISRKIKKLPGKKRSLLEIVAKRTFTVEQLATINRHCDSLDRLLLYLGLNCSFGAAESGRLEKEDLFLKQQNPIGYLWKHFDFTSSDGDSWIGYLRPKTGVAGMWWLWPETVRALEKWLEERPSTSQPRIVVTSKGNSLYRDESKNAQSGFQARWTDLLNRARAKDTSLPKFPFGTLRDQFSDWLVYKHKSETASIALAHGTPFKDDLMLCYANLPFPTLFEEQKEYRKFLRPVFDAAKK
jgi:integrase